MNVIILNPTMSSFKVALSFPINKFHTKKYFKESAYIYNDKCF